VEGFVLIPPLDYQCRVPAIGGRLSHGVWTIGKYLNSGRGIMRTMMGAIFGAIAGAVLGLAITIGFVYVKTHQPPDPRNPGAGAASPLFGVVAIPVCAICGGVEGAKRARRG
jgi:hypothetical protein